MCENCVIKSNYDIKVIDKRLFQVVRFNMHRMTAWFCQFNQCLQISKISWQYQVKSDWMSGSRWTYNEDITDFLHRITDSTSWEEGFSDIIEKWRDNMEWMEFEWTSGHVDKEDTCILIVGITWYRQLSNVSRSRTCHTTSHWDCVESLKWHKLARSRWRHFKCWNYSNTFQWLTYDPWIRSSWQLRKKTILMLNMWRPNRDLKVAAVELTKVSSEVR